MLGTYALDSRNNPILPSPRPVPVFDNIDPFQGGYKFCYFTLDRSTQEKESTLFDKLTKFLKGKEIACILVGSVLPNYKPVTIGEIIYPKADPRTIIETISELSYKYKFEECYTDNKTFDWLMSNNFWFAYCATRQEEIRVKSNQYEKDNRNKLDYQPLVIPNNYDLSLLKVLRNLDETIRLTEFSTAYEDGRIALMSKYFDDKKLTESIAKLENLLLCDSIGGLLAASEKYR